MAASFFDSSTLLILEPFEDDTFRRAASLGTIARPGLEGTHKRGPRLWVPPRVEEHSAQVLRAREHEWTHYRGHTSTTLGYFVHRLHAVREFCYMRFLQEQAGSEGTLNRADIIPAVQIAIGHAQSDLATGALAHWDAANAVLGCLWQKTVRNDDLEAAVRLLAPVLNSPITYVPGLSVAEELSISANGLPDAPTCPNGSITAESVVEGLSKYREYHELTVHFPPERVAELVAQQRRASPLEDALLLIEAQTSLPYSHPLVGALLDVATSSFPIEAVDGVQWTWEAIHPGARLQAAIGALADLRWIPKANDRPQFLLEMFDTVLAAYGEEPEQYRRRYELAGRALLNAAEEAGATQMEAWYSKSDEFDVYRLYSATLLERFGEAFLLRAEAPWIYWNPQLAFHVDRELWNRFVNVTAPPLVLGPSRFSMPLASSNGRYAHQLCLVAYLVGTGQTLVLRDLQRSGRLNHSAHFFRALRNPHQFNGLGEDMVLDSARTLIGNDLLRQLMEESRLV